METPLFPVPPLLPPKGNNHMFGGKYMWNIKIVTPNGARRYKNMSGN